MSAVAVSVPCAKGLEMFELVVTEPNETFCQRFNVAANQPASFTPPVVVSHDIIGMVAPILARQFGTISVLDGTGELIADYFAPVDDNQ